MTLSVLLPLLGALLALVEIPIVLAVRARRTDAGEGRIATAAIVLASASVPILLYLAVNVWTDLGAARVW